MSEVRKRLTRDEERQLCQLLGNVRMCLVYKASVHGSTPQAFHSKADMQGPTLVVAYNNSGCTYGGFSREGFRSRQGPVKDENAFLFGLNTGDRKRTPIKFLVKDPNTAIYDYTQHGPNFGNGSVHFLANGMQVAPASTNNYHCNGADLHGNDLTLVELEVYRLEDNDDIRDSAWRNIPWTAEEKQRLMELAKNYKPSMNKSPHIRVLMIGPVGAGKSSFFNSVNSVFRGHVATLAVAGSDATSVTTKFRTYPIKDEQTGKPLSLILCDSMGLEEKTGAGLETEDIPKILEGHVPDKYQFNPAASIQSNAPGYIRSPALKDKIHVVVFVLDACTVGILSEKLEDKLRHLRTKINHLEVPLLVLLTKVDELCPLVAEDIKAVYRSRAVEEQIHKAAARLGIPVSCILPIKNYSYELELENSIDILILHAVQQITRLAALHFDDVSATEEGNNTSPPC